MGDYLSKLSHDNPNPSSTHSNSTMTSPILSQPHHLTPESDSESPKPEVETLSEKLPEDSAEESTKPEAETLSEKVPEDSAEESNGNGEGLEEEEGECGFCLFMKAGGCRETFTDWEKCVEEGEKNKEDIVEKCFQVTSALTKCMKAHPDYYAPLLEAEEAAAKQLEVEKEKERPSDQATGTEELGKKNEEEKLGDSERKVVS